MESKASVKVKDGKLVNARVKYDGCIDEVKVTGDFFLEPADKLQSINEIFEGLNLDFDSENVVEKLESIDADFIGFKPEHVVEAVKDAIEK